MAEVTVRAKMSGHLLIDPILRDIEVIFRAAGNHPGVVLVLADNLFHDYRGQVVHCRRAWNLRVCCGHGIDLVLYNTSSIVAMLRRC